VYVTCGFDTNVGGITMDLLASDGTTPLASAAAVDNGSIISFNVTGASLTAGKVYVRITGSNAGNLYDLEWNSAAAQDAYGDNSTPPGAYDLGDATSGSLSAAAGQAILGTQGFYRLHVDSSHPTLLVDTMFDPNQGNLNVDLLDPNANEVETLAPAPAAEVVKLSTQSAATGGTYTLTVGGQTTSALAYNASAADIQAAMAALSTVGAGNVTATDDPTLGGLAAGGSCTLSFAAGLGALDVTGDFTGLTGTAPTLTEVTHGGVITGGNFTITVDGQTTAPIAYNAASQDIQAALNALSNITAGDVSVTGGPANSAAVVLTFGGKMGLRYVPVSVAIGQLTGGVITAAETHQGGQPLASGSRILMQLPPEVLTAGYCYLRVSPVQLNAQVTSQGIPYDLSWKTGVVGANGQDAFQGPNGIATSSNAYDLSAHKGQWLSDIAGLAILNNQEYFKLAVTAAQPRMLVQARFNASVDPNDFLLQIFAQDGTTELARGTTASGGMAAWAVMPPSVIKAGYCYVLVSSGAGDYMGAAYDLKWDGGVGADQYGANSGGTSVAENDTMQTAYPLPANPQGQWLSQITGKGPAMAIDSHYYRLTLTAGQPRVVVQTQAMAFLGAVTVWLYKSDGTLLAQSQPLPGGALLTTVVGADVMADGACYILITSQTISQTGNVVPKGILYDFSYQTMAADDGSTLNDSLQHARDISGQQDVNIPAISGNASGNDDWYSVTVPANSRLLDASVSDAANLAMTLSLYDNQGTLLESGGFFNGRSSVNDTMPAAGTYVLKAHMDQVGVPYTLHWDAQEAASQILVGAGGASSVKFADADGTNVTVTAAGGGAIVLSFLGGNIASTLSNGVATVTAQAGTLQLDTIDLSSATRQTHITITTDSHGDGRTAVNSIIGDAVVGSFYARTTDVVGQGVSMIANGCISQLTLGAMGTGTAMIMTGSGVTTGLVLNASLFSGNMIAVVGSPIGLMTLGAWVGRGSTLTGQYITRLNVTGLSSVNSLPASLVGANHDAIAAGAMDTDLLMIGKDALGNAIGTATVAGDAQGTWDVTGTTVGNINSIRLNGPQNNWSLEAAGSRVNSLWVRGEFFQNTLNAKSFNLLTLQGNVGLSTLTAWQFTTVNIGGQFVDSKIEATGHTPDSTDNTAVGGVIRNLTVNGNMTGATITAQQMGTALITGNVSYTAWSVTGHTAATTTDVSAPGLILGLTVKGNVTGSTVTAQQMVTALITGNLDTTTWQVTGHTATTSGDTNAVGLLGSLTVNGNITSSALTAGHDPSATDTTARLGGFGRIVVNGNISSSTLAAAGSSLLSDDRRYTGLASLMAGRISESNISIAGGIGSFNAIDWSDAVAHGHSLTAGWVRSLIVHGGTGAAGNLQPDVSIADYLQSASIRGQLSSLILINDTLPPLVGDALGSLVAGSIQDANIAVGGTGGIGSITTSQWLKTGVANNVSATYLKSLVAYHGNMQANLSIHDYIGTLSVSGLLKGSAVQAQNRISSVVVGGAENSSIFVGSFTGTDTLGAGGTPDGVFDLPSVSDVWAAETPSTGSPNPGQGHLLRLIVTGAAKDGGYSFINTNIAAIKMDSITIVHPDESPNAVAFGLAGDTISALSITDSHGRHTWRMLLSSGQAPAPLAKLEVRVA
jgi:hypothetical protein